MFLYARNHDLMLTRQCQLAACIGAYQLETVISMRLHQNDQISIFVRLYTRYSLLQLEVYYTLPHAGKHENTKAKLS